MHPLDEARRSDEGEGAGPVQADPQQAVEAGDVVEMRVGHEGVAHPQELARRHRAEIAEIEQDGAAAEAEIETETPGSSNGPLRSREGRTSQLIAPSRRPVAPGRAGRDGAWRQAEPARPWLMELA